MNRTLVSRRHFAIGTGLSGLLIALGIDPVRADHDGPTALAEHGVDPMLAFNPTTNTSYVAWVQSAPADAGQATATPDGQMAMPPSGQVLLARSTDGGATFAEPVVASGTDSDVMSYVGSSPLVIVGPTGDVSVVYQRNVPHEGVDFGRDILRIARSTDDGQSFAPAVDVFSESDALEAGTFHDAIVGPDGAIYVAWLSYRQYMPENNAGDDPKVEVRITRSDDGITFGPSVLVDDSSCECCRTALAIDRDGLIYLAWRDQEEQADGGDPVRNMVISRSANRGASWEPAVPIHNDGWRVAQCPESGPAIAVDGNGLVRASWFTGKEGGAGVYYAASDDGGRTFSTPVALVTDEYFPHANVRASLGQDGAFWVTWDDPRTEAGAIGLARIDANGQPEPGLPAELAGRTSDVVATPDGPLLAWVSDAGVSVELVPSAEQDS